MVLAGLTRPRHGRTRRVFSCVVSSVVVRRVTQRVLECLPKSATVAVGGRDIVPPEGRGLLFV